MKIQDVIDFASLHQIMPSVSHKEFGRGVVTCIKVKADNSAWKGIAVKFESLPYDKWFNENQGSDKRSTYMSELTFNA